MRSRLNVALVVAAGALALVLTVIRQSPEGVMSLELDTQEVRAAPGEAQMPRHDLSALKIFNITLVRIKDRYVEPARDMDVSTSGKFGGLGIVIRMIERKLTVVKPMKDTPAWRKGIKAGDHIVKINQEPTENLTSNEAVDRMRGDPKTGVTLYIERKGSDGLLRFDLIRDVIRVSQVEHKLLDKGVGYLRVKQFSKGIASDVAEAMREM